LSCKSPTAIATNTPIFGKLKPNPKLNRPAIPTIKRVRSRGWCSRTVSNGFSLPWLRRLLFSPCTQKSSWCCYPDLCSGQHWTSNSSVWYFPLMNQGDF
jgi:hypothetical protein